MAERICEKCGASNPASSSFCRACDTFVEWHLPTQEERDDSGAGPPPGRGLPFVSADVVVEPAAPESRAKAPVVGVDDAEVTVAPDAPGTCSVRLTNTSSIVESYEVTATDALGWLVLEHDDINLMPGTGRVVPLRLSVRPGSTAVAQRLRLRLCVRSTVDPRLTSLVGIDVVVPKVGPPPQLLARPHMIRMVDLDRGSFALHLDNTAANFPRRYRLASRDPEGVVSCDFVPPVVDVPAGGTAEVAARTAAPAPPPGEQTTRQLTLSATDDDGEVTVLATLVQSTSPEPERVPVRLLLEPSRVSATDAQSATMEVVVDNRTGHHQAEIQLHGRDPERALWFDFERPNVSVPPGRAYRVRAGVGGPMPPRGQTASRPFTIVVTENGEESTADGTLELTSREAAISTARIRVVPEHLMVQARRGTFTVEIDNRLGAEPLHVHLSGADEFGRAGLAFAPVDVEVPPGGVGGSTLTVRHPRPPGGSSASRRVRVMASSGVDAIHAEAVFTQKAESRRRVWAILLVLLGSALTAIGAIAYARVPGFIVNVEPAARSIVADIAGSSVPPEFAIRVAAGALVLAIVALCVVLMLLGLNGTGRLVRTAALLAALAAVGVTVALLVTGGLVFVLVGAVVAFVGGILLRDAG